MVKSLKMKQKQRYVKKSPTVTESETRLVNTNLFSSGHIESELLELELDSASFPLLHSRFKPWLNRQC